MSGNDLNNHVSEITIRKEEHIRICMEEQVEGTGIQTGLERYRFKHNALPEIAWKDISIETKWLGHDLKTPFLVSSMTGGTPASGSINQRLAKAAEERGWAIGLGSMRAAIENEQLAKTFAIRSIAPTVPIIANLGAVQLNYGFGLESCERAVELAQADALVLHLNSMQEIFQPSGDTDFSHLVDRIHEVCHKLTVPVGIKEVGWGIDGETASKLHEAGVSFIDTAGAGGTSWSQVEKYRTSNLIQKDAAEAFANWGTPTAECIIDIREQLPQIALIASGGMNNGVDAAKAIGLGADLVGFGRSLLPQAVSQAHDVSIAQLLQQLERIEFELRAAMFGIGASKLEQLKYTNRLHLI